MGPVLQTPHLCPPGGSRKDPQHLYKKASHTLKKKKKEERKLVTPSVGHVVAAWPKSPRPGKARHPNNMVFA